MTKENKNKVNTSVLCTIHNMLNDCMKISNREEITPEEASKIIRDYAAELFNKLKTEASEGVRDEDNADIVGAKWCYDTGLCDLCWKYRGFKQPVVCPYRERIEGARDKKRQNGDNNEFNG